MTITLVTGASVILLRPAEEFAPARDLVDPVEMPTLDPVATSDLDLPIAAPLPPVPDAIVAEPPNGLQVVPYTVRSGDTVHGLAERFGVSAETIVWANDLADADLLSIGDTLEIPPVSGVLHRVRPGDTAAELVSFYGGALREVFEVNRLEPPFIIVVGQPLLIPGGKVPPSVTPEASAESACGLGAVTAIGDTACRDGGSALVYSGSRSGRPAIAEIDRYPRIGHTGTSDS